jgi:thiol-disulfide isomerase/thioredoxin
MKKTRYVTFLIIFVVFLLSVTSAIAEDQIIVDFYYSESCGECQAIIPIINDVTARYAENYSGKVVIQKKEVGSNKTNYNEMVARDLSFPSVIINNETIIPESHLTYAELTKAIDDYLTNRSNHTKYDKNVIDLPWIGPVNLTSYSLPVLTIVLGGLDSFNPCAFFVLFILLSLLVFLKSRWKIILVGGIFIFFSGLFYFFFMLAVLTTIQLVQILIISIIAGCIAVILGSLNIKDFFFFKKGPSTSMSVEKRKKIFKRMRDLIHNAYLPGVLGGTIFLAITVNLYELLCSLGFPLVYVTRLAAEHLPTINYYIYLLLYNIIYVIPLLVLVLVFAFTLGKMKLSEWRGRQLKLFSGGMLFSMGLILIINYMILENFFTPIVLFIGNIFATLLISFIWKKYKKEPKETSTEEQPSEENA